MSDPDRLAGSPPADRRPARGTEAGDRAGFLARIADRQGRPVAAGPHAPPPPPESIPSVRLRSLDGLRQDDTDGLVAAFTAAAEAVDTVVHVGHPAVAVAELVRVHDVVTAVVSEEEAVSDLIPHLEQAGVSVHGPDKDTAATADLGVTGAVGAIAATGSVVVDADLAGGRTTSLLPRVHLCVLDRNDIVLGTEEILRTPPRPLPAHRVLVTGPSRTGDIEQILTLGAHGPVALHVLVL